LTAHQKSTQKLQKAKPISLNFTHFLGHPKVKLLITHCGMNSLLEAAHAGVPMIGFPTIGDQYPNSESVKRHGMGLILDLYSFNHTQLSDSIQKVLRPDSIESKSAEKIKNMLKFKRERKIALDGSFAFKRFMRMSQESFEKFWILKDVGWIRHFYLDLALILFILVRICCF
jgi:glucuronosyltransferase